MHNVCDSFFNICRYLTLLSILIFKYFDKINWNLILAEFDKVQLHWILKANMKIKDVQYQNTFCGWELNLELFSKMANFGCTRNSFWKKMTIVMHT